MTLDKGVIRLVVFDMAGTTVHDEDFVHQALADALEAAGVAVSREDINAVMGYPKPVAIRTLLETETDPENQLPERTDAIHADFLERINTFYRTAPGVREVEGTKDTFSALKASAIKVALDTGFSRPTADIIIDRLGWTEDGLVDLSITSDEVDRGRPYPDMIHRAMHLLDIEDSASVAKVGDTPSDLQEGRQARCGAIIGVTYGSHSRDELATYPHTHLVSDIREIPALLGLNP